MASFVRFSSVVCGVVLVLWSTLWASEPTPNQPALRSKRVAVKSSDAKSLAPLLKPSPEPLRLKLLAGIEASSLADAAVVECLSQFVDRESAAERFSPSLLRAVQLLGASNLAAATDRMLSLLSAKDARLVMLAADMASTRKHEAALEPLLKLADRKDYSQQFGLRRSAVDAIARYPQKSAVDFLVATVADSKGQLKYEAVRHLTRLTGQHFGGHANEWISWWQTHRDTFDFTSVASTSVSSSKIVDPQALGTRMPWPEQVPEFYGVAVYAQRVCFVLDRSNSMASSVDGELRLDRAVQELERAILALPSDSYFNVVAFSTDIRPFRRELIQATPEGKRQGISFAHSLTPEDLTNCHDALMAGLDFDANLEAILFLSDGEPTAGPIVEPTALIEAVTARNFFQRSTINTIGIDARGAHEQFLRQLAERNFGTYKSAR